MYVWVCACYVSSRAHWVYSAVKCLGFFLFIFAKSLNSLCPQFWNPSSHRRGYTAAVAISVTWQCAGQSAHSVRLLSPLPDSRMFPFSPKTYLCVSFYIFNLCILVFCLLLCRAPHVCKVLESQKRASDLLTWSSRPL